MSKMPSVKSSTSLLVLERSKLINSLWRFWMKLKRTPVIWKDWKQNNIFFHLPLTSGHFLNTAKIERRGIKRTIIELLRMMKLLISTILILMREWMEISFNLILIFLILKTSALALFIMKITTIREKTVTRILFQSRK